MSSRSEGKDESHKLYLEKYTEKQGQVVWIVERIRYRPTNRPTTDRPTDTASYRGALSHLITDILEWFSVSQITISGGELIRF